MLNTTTITREGTQIVIRGDLVFDTALQVLSDSRSLLALSAAWNICLAHVPHADSAGLALLIFWFRQARVQNKTVCVSDIPVQMQKLINVSGLNYILPLVPKVHSPV